MKNTPLFILGVIILILSFACLVLGMGCFYKTFFLNNSNSVYFIMWSVLICIAGICSVTIPICIVYDEFGIRYGNI
jgi:hypothetical protein